MNDEQGRSAANDALIFDDGVVGPTRVTVESARGAGSTSDARDTSAIRSGLTHVGSRGEVDCVVTIDLRAAPRHRGTEGSYTELARTREVTSAEAPPSPAECTAEPPGSRSERRADGRNHSRTARVRDHRHLHGRQCRGPSRPHAWRERRGIGPVRRGHIGRRRRRARDRRRVRRGRRTHCARRTGRAAEHRGRGARGTRHQSRSGARRDDGPLEMGATGGREPDSNA